MRTKEVEARRIEKDYLNLETPGLPNIVLKVEPKDLDFYLDLGRQYGVIDRNLDLRNLVVQ